MSDHVPRLSHEEQFSSHCPCGGIITVGAVDVIVPIKPVDIPGLILQRTPQLNV